MTETNFTIQWLLKRFAYDSIARNKQVEQSCLDYFKHNKDISILDIGSGTGASCIYFMEKITANQVWTLVELNPELAKASAERIAAYAVENGYIVQQGAQQLFLQKKQKFVTVHIRQESFLQMDSRLDWGSIDLLTATAVFDLLSKELFAKFIEPIITYRIPLLGTINYERMSFLPTDSLSEKYADLYTQHMVRPQAFGHAMGGNCIREITSLFRQNGLSFVSGESNWRIPPEDATMRHYLLDYMADAIPELLQTTDELATFTEWLANKRQQKNLTIIVEHRDFFLYF